MSQQQGSMGGPGGAEGPPSYKPPALEPQPPSSIPSDPPPGPAAPLEPGRGAPLVTGPPRSVNEPLSARRVNTVFGIGGVVGIVALVIVVVLVGLLLFSLLSHH